MPEISTKKLKILCGLADIDYSPSETKTSLKKKVVKYLNKYTYAPRYLRGLSPSEKFTKMFEIRLYKLREKHGKISPKQKYKPSIIDKKYLRSNKRSKSSKSRSKSKKISRYTKDWNKKYGEKSISLSAKSKISGVPLSILKKVYNKGLAAWRGGSHRPGASQHQWGVSRVNSFLTCGKTWYFPDHKLAQEAMNKSPKARKFWSKKKCVKSKMGKRTKSR
jgi:hypothetical protein|uniref:DUF5824 domain-containing protein n=1 Tax=viral metagenome TaxID=1070528 RepID=A0A6C0I586_9ZZZZ